MKDSQGNPPLRTQWLYNGFVWYANRMVRRAFEAMAVEDSTYRERNIAEDVPVIIYANHPSWWDPILAVLLHEHLFGKTRGFYAPIDAVALKKYDVLSKLGFYPISMDSFGGAADFLRTSKAILNKKSNAIWLTPEGQFTDARKRDVALMPGLAHLFGAIERVVAIPLAIEYVFWNEAKPYMLMRLGTPIDSAEMRSQTKAEVQHFLSDKLRENQSQLESSVIQRRLEPFKQIHRTAAGPKSLYDFARAFKSILRRKPVQLRHDSQ
jgi:1-acyl-sn-glycerol-3-phosphate acyltransferase